MLFCSTKPPLWRDATFQETRIDCGSLKSIAVCSEQILRYSADEGGPMGKVVAMELVSLEGVLEGPGGVRGL